MSTIQDKNENLKITLQYMNKFPILHAFSPSNHTKISKKSPSFFLIEKLFRAGHTRRPYHKILSSMKNITKLNVEGYRFYFWAGEIGF